MGAVQSAFWAALRCIYDSSLTIEVGSVLSDFGELSWRTDGQIGKFSWESWRSQLSSHPWIHCVTPSSNQGDGALIQIIPTADDLQFASLKPFGQERRSLQLGNLVLHIGNHRIVHRIPWQTFSVVQGR